MTKSIFFLDIDGTISNIPGGNTFNVNGKSQNCLFSKYGGKDNFSSTNIKNYLYLSNGKNVSKLVILFFQKSQEKGVEIIPVTNNYQKTVLRYLELLGIKNLKRGSYRESEMKKTEYINQIVEKEPENEYIYFDDTPSYFIGLRKEVETVDCSNGNWLGKQLYDEINKI